MSATMQRGTLLEVRNADGSWSRAAFLRELEDDPCTCGCPHCCVDPEPRGVLVDMDPDHPVYISSERKFRPTRHVPNGDWRRA